MADLKLKHIFLEIDTILAFYDGELPVVAGVVTVPSGHPEWVAQALRQGWEIDPETGASVSLEEGWERNAD